MLLRELLSSDGCTPQKRQLLLKSKKLLPVSKLLDDATVLLVIVLLLSRKLLLEALVLLMRNLPLSRKLLLIVSSC